MNRTTLVLICGAVLLAIGGGAANGTAQALARLNPTPPCAALVAAAQAKGIALEGIDLPSEGDGLEPGDSLSALVTMFEKGEQPKQWLIHLEAIAPNAEERAQKVAPPMVLYSSFGGTQTCVSVPAFVEVRTLGPFVKSSRQGKAGNIPEKRARFGLNKGFLGLGFDNASNMARCVAPGRCGISHSAKRKWSRGGKWRQD